MRSDGPTAIGIISRRRRHYLRYPFLLSEALPPGRASEAACDLPPASTSGAMWKLQPLRTIHTLGRWSPPVPSLSHFSHLKGPGILRLCFWACLTTAVLFAAKPRDLNSLYSTLNSMPRSGNSPITSTSWLLSWAPAGPGRRGGPWHPW